ncbi:hypothetical protein C5O00_10945 [Pukyongia salina]|uniref:Uncharacterized protein n=1 Tax=Pukyongia salina TaxID=2094025 RepID=A0A2S0HYB5_9FLAO|nr:hypothetical protein [Pukyongia salina]AVI51649.1 hypothetical protein C5O00_10945 [Pukyongia salina]
MDTYKVDDSAKHVKIDVKVGSTGSAETRVYLDTITADNRICESDDNSNGNIPATKAGINRKLFLRTLIVNTSLNFSNIPDSAVKDAIKMTHIIYTLDGGPQGEKPFNNLDAIVNDSDISSVEITKRIEFV